MIKTPWQILNIPGNSDERAIKRAYAQALKALDPDDREGFIALREAYEAALRMAHERQAFEEAAAPVFDAPPRFDDAAAPVFDAPQALDGDAAPLRAPAYFLHDCWCSWQDAQDDAALLAHLQAQQAMLARYDLDTAIAYAEQLLDWFDDNEAYHNDAFAWAYAAYGWQAARQDLRFNDLYERYPSIFHVPPKIEQYPALAQWDAQWRRGFWARLRQAIHPLRRSEAQAAFDAYCDDSFTLDVKGLPPALRALYDLAERQTFIHVLSFVPLLFGVLLLGFWRRDGLDEALVLLLCGLWLAYLLSAAVYETLKIAGVRLTIPGALGVSLAWAGVIAAIGYGAPSPRNGFVDVLQNLIALLMLYMGAVFWQRRLAALWRWQWSGWAPAWQWMRGGLWMQLLLVVGVFAFGDLQDGAFSERAIVFYVVLLPLAGAAFAATVLHCTPLPQRTRVQYASALWQAAVLLPVLWLVLKNVPMRAGYSALLWGYGMVSIIDMAMTPMYRRWHEALPRLLGVGIFIVVMREGALVWLIAFQLGLWILLPLAILASPRFPRAGRVLPQTLRSFTHSILAFVVPLVFWYAGLYGALACSLGVACYVRWIAREVDQEARRIW